mgnify:CR=1 FL=1
MSLYLSNALLQNFRPETYALVAWLSWLPLLVLGEGGRWLVGNMRPPGFASRT